LPPLFPALDRKGVAWVRKTFDQVYEELCMFEAMKYETPSPFPLFDSKGNKAGRVVLIRRKENNEHREQGKSLGIRMPADRKVRFYFRTGDVHRYFCWFRMTSEELYFGSAAKTTIDVPVMTTMEQRVTMNIPSKDTPRFPGVPTKASYHSSGQFHIKLGEKMKGEPIRWPKKSDITSPFTIAAVITRTAENYPVATEKQLKKPGHAIIVLLGEGQEGVRHYMEFMLSPEGTHDLPAPVLATKGQTNAKPIIAALSKDLYLVARHSNLIPAAEINTFRPGFEIWFHPEDKKEEETRSKDLPGGVRPEHLKSTQKRVSG
jgi:hypothetical protein